MSFTQTKPNQIERKWYVVDARGMVLGRLATRIAEVLLGKHQPYFSPQWDMGDNVIVINAERVVLTGNKETDKTYYRHTGYPGGMRTQSAAEVRERYPERLIERAVRGMLPKNRLQDVRMEKLHVYAGTDHEYASVKPEELVID
ncbi:50S ribosomal protein L13 [candidate division WWE3 bacterium]|uniref:Large ribosomal subunit protein uL13 n=1 Tax=candidate division WWE3 bacterium TaxID=2053526 RepID=A0A955LWI5_UNCKA|nr:50S ribosomal protein L13 [candidate division WWE3 bacterium]